MEIKYLNIIAILTITSLSFILPAFATPSNVYEIQVPKKIGIVKERYRGTSRNPPIVYIQNTARPVNIHEKIIDLMVHFLDKGKYETLFVGLEGTSGPLDQKKLEELSSDNSVWQVAEFLLRQEKVASQMSGDHFETQIQLFGVEDPDLLFMTSEVSSETAALGKKALKDLKGIEEKFQPLRQNVFREELFDFNRLSNEFFQTDHDPIPFYEEVFRYTDFLEMVPSTFSEFPILKESLEYTQRIDRERLNMERDYLIKVLSSNISTEEKKAFEEEIFPFLKEDRREGELYELLEIKRGKLNLKRGNYPNIIRYLKYFRKFRQLDIKALEWELLQLSFNIQSSLAKTKDERAIVSWDMFLTVYRHLIDLNAELGEVNYYYTNKSWFLWSRLRDFLRSHGLKVTIQNTLSKAGDAAERFYDLADLRSQVMVQELLGRPFESGEEIRLLIAGRYHTAEITKRLKERDVSYVIVAIT